MEGRRPWYKCTHPFYQNDGCGIRVNRTGSSLNRGNQREKGNLWELYWKLGDLLGKIDNALKKIRICDVGKGFGQGLGRFQVVFMQ